MPDRPESTASSRIAAGRTATIRTAVKRDLNQLLEIYRPYVESTAISFEFQVPKPDEFAARIERALSRWTWLVAERDGELLGYAYATAHRAREAYARSVETTVYVSRDHHRAGVGRLLYAHLFMSLSKLGYASAFAGITLPNPASVGFHESFGFEAIGIFPRVGYKQGRWHDVAWFYRPVN